KKGLDPVTAIQMATLNTAEYFGLKDRGAVAPGYRADIAVLKDLENVLVESVIKNGILRVENGQLLDFEPQYSVPVAPKPLAVAPLRPDSFRIEDRHLPVRVIEFIPGQILTNEMQVRMPSEKGVLMPDIEGDIAKIAVLERHHATGNIGIGFVKGFGLKEGAIASSIAHDSHNIIAVGTSDRDLVRAVESLRDMCGGMVVSHKGRILARVVLELGGLMTRVSLEELNKDVEDLNRAAASLGCTVDEPFMALSFLALPVIPKLKLTDLGLVDVEKFRPVSLYVG
ncbi:MAG: adenine deaminase C-terminal domain-containing protein, partial [Pseudomonadota bacterium]